jgi:hypothetical protein
MYFDQGRSMEPRAHDRYIHVDKEGLPCSPRAPEYRLENYVLKENETAANGPSHNLVEVEDKSITLKRQLFPMWGEIIKLIYAHTGKSNLIDAAYEGGFRLERRYENMFTAFTYGFKLTYDDLDDPALKKKIQDHLNAKLKKYTKAKKIS